MSTPVGSSPIGATPPRSSSAEAGTLGDPPNVGTPQQDSTKSRTQENSPSAQSGTGPERSDNEVEWIWQKDVGWQKLPARAVRGTGTGTSYKAWFDKDQCWDHYYLIGEQEPYPDVNTNQSSPQQEDPWRQWGSSPDAKSERSEDGASREWDGYNRWDKDDKYRKRDGDIPEWDGKVVPRVNYFRKIDLWCQTTGVPEEERAIRLLQKLIGQCRTCRLKKDRRN